jgi:tetratricopeptide (TPR) repeat protein
VIDDLNLHRCVPAIQLKVTLAGVLTMRGDLLTAHELLENTEVDAALSGSDEALASVLWNSAHLARERGMAAESERLARRAVQLFDQAANMHRYAATLIVWADVALDGDAPNLDEIERRLTQGLDLVRQFGDTLEIGYGCHDLGRLRAAQGRTNEALAALDEALAFLGPENILETARCLITRSAVAMEAGQQDLARSSAGKAQELLEQTPANYRAARLWTALAEDYFCVVADMPAALQCYRNAAASWLINGPQNLPVGVPSRTA